jgi:hypothetical protein
MACKSLVSEYTEVVKNLIQNNPKYREYDNAALLVLTNNELDPEQKKQAIHYFANIYKGLVGIDSKAYNPGQLQKVLNISSKLNSTKEYLELVEKYYDMQEKETPKTAKELIDESISKLANKTATAINLTEVNDVLDDISNYMDSQEFETEEDYITQLEEFQKQLLGAIDTAVKGTATNKKNLAGKVLKKIDSLKTGTPYVDLSTLSTKLNYENRVWVFLKSGNVIEGLKKDGDIFVYDYDNGDFGELIPKETIQETKNIRPDITQRDNVTDGSFVVRGATIYSGFTLKPMDGGNVGAFYEDLNKMSPNENNLEIKAVRLGSLGDSRVKEFHNLANEDKKMQGLLNRTYETFESKSQVELLSNDKREKIITVRRPNKSDGIAFIGKIKGTNHNFFLYNVDGFTIVDAYNNTVPFDFENSEHIKLLKKKGVHTEGYRKSDIRNLTDGEVDSLIQANKLYKKFKEEMTTMLDESGTNSLDVTSEFFKRYDTAVARPKIVKSYPLTSLLKSDKSLSTPVTLVTVKGGKVVEGSEEQFDLPIHFTLTVGEDKKLQYTLKNILPRNKRILNSEGRPVSEQVYISKLFGAEGKSWFDVLDKIFTAQYTRYIDKGQNIHAHRVLIKTDDQGNPTGYQAVNYTPAVHYGQGFVQYALELTSLDNNNWEQIKNFDQKLYSFQLLNQKGNNGPAMIKANIGSIKPVRNEQTGIVEKEGVMLLEIRPANILGRTSPFDGFFKPKSHYNIELAPYITKLRQRLDELKSEYIPKVLEDYGDVLSLKAQDKESINNFMEEAYTLYEELGDAAEDSLKELVNRTERLSVDFSNAVGDAVDKMVKKNFGAIVESQAKEGKTEFIDLLKESFVFKNAGDDVSDYNFRRLVVDENAGIYINAVELNAQRQFSKGIETISVPDLHTERFIVTPKSNTKSTKKHTDTKPEVVETAETPTKETQEFMDFINSQAGLTNVPSVNEAIKNELKNKSDKSEKNKKIKPQDEGPQDLTDGPVGPMFSVEQEADDTRDQLPLAQQWLASTLPQFGLEISDLSDIVDLSTINGHVLGAYKDKMLYLNKELAGAGTLYHEAFHGVFRNLMDAQLRNDLIQAVTSNARYASQFTDSALRQFASDRNINASLDKLKRLKAEEILADGFKAYMLEETKPKGILARFFEMLKKLLRFFNKNSRTIDRAFKDIRTGVYTRSELQSELYQGEYALEAIPGVARHYEDVNTGEYYGNTTERGALTSYHRNNLVNVMVSNILQDHRDVKFSEKFDDTADMLIRMYDIDKVVETTLEKDPKATEAEIRAKWTGILTNYRFMLGARMNQEEYGPTYDENLSNNPRHNNYQVKQSVKGLNGEKIDNSLGQYSKEVLKKEVRKAVDEILSVQIEFDNDEVDDVQEVLSGEVAESQKDDQNDVKEDEGGESSFDDSFGNENVVNQVKYVRSLLATVEINQPDETGVTLPRVVDAISIFPVLLKITAGIDPTNIIDRLETISKQMLKDGYMDVHYQIQAVYDRIVQDTGMDQNEDKVPVRNHHIHNMFVEVLNVLELDYTMVDIVTPQKLSQEQLGLNIADNNIKHSVEVKDSVLNSDLKNKKNDFVKEIILQFTNTKNTAKHREAVTKLKSLIKKVSTSDIVFMYGENDTQMVENLTDELHSAFNDIGLNLPKSLITMSLIAIDSVENDLGIPLEATDPELYNLYKLHEGFIKEKKYLEKAFFRDLESILDKMYTSSGAKNTSQFVQFMEEDIAQRGKKEFKQKNTVFNILRKSSEYILKYDPQSIQSVIKNAEGKNIYRYAKYNPLLHIAQKIKQEGLKAVMESDPYYEHSLKEWMLDHPMLGEYFRKLDSGEELSNEDLIMQEYIRNLNFSLLGGVQQRIGDKLKPGKSFKGFDDKAHFLVGLAAFMSREQVLAESNDDSVNYVTLYKRQYHQLESTSTNFLLNAMYRSYVDVSSQAREAGKKSVKDWKTNEAFNKGWKLFENEYVAIVEDLLKVVGQEYNRIARESKRAGDKIKKYNSKKGNDLVLKYDAQFDSDGKVIKAGRAYKFNRLQTFWETNGELKEKLLGAINNNISFEELDAETLTQLKRGLDLHAKQEFNDYLSQLEKFGVIKFGKKQMKQATGTKEVEVVESSYLPKEVKLDFEKQDVQLNYGQPSKGGVDTGLENLIYDHFMNNWHSGLMMNQVFDGDPAMGTKNDTDYVKRLKKFAAAGPNMKQGQHRVAYMDSIEEWVHEKHVEYGPYPNLQAIEDDFTLTDSAIKEEIRNGFIADEANKKVEGYEPQGSWYPVFDGQSISSLMHQMDQYDTFGRLDPKSQDILIAKHYRALTPEEMKYLKKMRIANNSKKTVTAGRYTYHKLSEYFIDRNDVSYFSHPREEGMTEAQYAQSKKDRLSEIHNMYSQIYNLRKQIENDSIQGLTKDIITAEKKIKELVKDIHSSFKPKKHRVVLHDMLNSMEFQQIDQMMDVEASKQATRLPLNVNAPRTKEGHFDLAYHSIMVDNYLKYLQVETSGVKEKAKVGVQKKVLLPADIPLLIEELRVKSKAGQLTKEEEKSLTNLANALNSYNTTLKESADARFQYLKNVIRKGEALDINKMYKLIQQSLIDQKAPMDQIQLFDLVADEDGTLRPAVNPNLPMVRNMVEYFFFNHYSQHVTDEKAAGFKSFHVSQWGWKVLVDENNVPVYSFDYDENPEAYENDAKYRVRNLGVSVEEKDGIKTYWTEVVVPLPQFDTVEERQWYMDFMRKAFGTRIPTEDKRSMIAMKIVDFIDSSKLNTVIVPQYVHILAGSDFDIDSLFGQMYATYKNAKGETVKYGDTSMYQNEKAGEYIEFLHYMESKPEFKNLIKKKRQALYEDKKERFNINDSEDDNDPIMALDFEEGSPIWNLLSDTYGFTEEDLQEAKKLQNYVVARKRLIAEAETLYKEKEKLKGELFGEEAERFNKTEEFLKREHERLKDLSLKNRQKNAQHKALKGTVDQGYQILDYIMTYQPIIDVLSEYAMPITYDSYKKNPMIAMMVAPRYQNRNLTYSLDMLSNEHVFKELYINERTSDKMFTDLARDAFGMTVEQYMQKGDIYTPQAVVQSKSETSSFKDGIGITANTNKFLSVASTFEMELNPESVIWNFQQTKDNTGKESKKEVSARVFHKRNANGQRSIGITGGMLGVFADAAKSPVPVVLQLNEVNTQAGLVMTALGLDEGMVFGFNYIPELAKAAQNVMEAKHAVTDDFKQEVVWFNRAIDNQILDLVATEETADGWREANSEFADMINKGLIKVKEDKDPMKSFRRFELDKTNIVINFEYKQALTPDRVRSGQVSLDEIGFEVAIKNEDGSLTNLSEDIQKVILLKYYSEQVAQLFKIKNAGGLTSFHKKLNPNTQVFDRLFDGTLYMQPENEDNIFTEESLKRLMSKDSVYSVATDVLRDANNQLRNIFIERRGTFYGIQKLFEYIYKDHRALADIFTGVVASRSYFNNLLLQDPNDLEFDIQKSVLEDEKNALRELMNPSTMFNGKFVAEVEMMKKKYPDNKFLQKIKTSSGNQVIFMEHEGNKIPVKEQNVSLFEKVKLKGPLLEDVTNDLMDLYARGREAKLFVKKLFWNEILRTGGQINNIKGAYMNIMPIDLKQEFSKYLDKTIEKFNTVNQIINNADGTYTINGKNYKTLKGAEKFLEKQRLDLNEEVSKILGEDITQLNGDVVEHIIRAAIADPENTRIPSGQAMKYQVGLTQDTKKGKKGDYRTGFAKEVASLRGEENLFDKVMKEIKAMLPGTALNEALLKSEKRLDLSNPNQVALPANLIIKAHPSSFKINNDIASAVGVNTTYIQTEDGFIPAMTYPAVVRIGRKYYMLDTINGEKVLDKVDSFDEYSGTEATYKLVDTSISEGTSNMLAWSRLNMQKYSNIISGATILRYEKTPDTLQSQPEPSAPAVKTESPKVETMKKWSRKDVLNNPDKVFLFGDNFEDAKTGYVPKSTQAVARGADNAIGISTKKNRKKGDDSFLSDADFEMFKAHVDGQIQKAIKSGKTIVLPEDGIGTGAADLKTKAPMLNKYLQGKLKYLQNGITSGIQSEIQTPWNRENRQIGTDSDKQMREAADGFIGEIVNPGGMKSGLNVYDKLPQLAGTSTTTSAFQIANKVQKKFNEKQAVIQRGPSENSRTIGVLPKDVGPNSVIMLARNGQRSGQDLDRDTKDFILSAYSYGATFILGNFYNVDTQYVNFLNEIGAAYSIYSSPKKKSEEQNSKVVVTEGNIQYVKDPETAKLLHNKNKGLYTMRVSEKQYKSNNAPKQLSHERHFGNPWTGTDKEGAIKVDGIEQAVNNYEDWLDGKAHQEVEPERRKFILGAIAALKKNGYPLVYHSQGYRSHADVLDERINGAKSKKLIKTKKEKLINDQDIDGFKSYIKKSFGKQPQQFATKNTVFKEFFNPQTGKREKMPQSASWILNPNGLYDLTDVETGEVFIQNVNLKDGFRYDVKLAGEELEQPNTVVQYTPKGKERQTYTVLGKQIFNSKGDEVFKSQSIDRNKILANLAVQQGRAVVVGVDQANYVVFNNNEILSVTSGKPIVQETLVKKAIAAADVKRANIAKGNPNDLQNPNEDDINNCKS